MCLRVSYVIDIVWNIVFRNIFGQPMASQFPQNLRATLPRAAFLACSLGTSQAGSGGSHKWWDGTLFHDFIRNGWWLGVPLFQETSIWRASKFAGVHYQHSLEMHACKALILQKLHRPCFNRCHNRNLAVITQPYPPIQFLPLGPHALRNSLLRECLLWYVYPFI